MSIAIIFQLSVDANTSITASITLVNKILAHERFIVFLT